MKLNENLTVIKDLGAGAFGQVYLCNYHKDGFNKEVAVKKVNNQDNKEKVIKEALINSELNHPNIVQIFNIEYDSKNNVLFIYEYIEGISLREFTDSNPKVRLGVAVYIFTSLLKGLEFSHSKNIIHHDISPRNIILSIHGEVKILDFGLAKLQGSHQAELSEISGSISYYDPYLIQNRKSYDKEADLYSAILIFYELLTGRRFFPSSSPLETIDFLKGFQSVDDIDLEDIDDDKLREIIRYGLYSKREKRLSISEIKERLKDFKIEHPNVFLFTGHEKKVEKTFSQKKNWSDSFFKKKQMLFSFVSISVILILIAAGISTYRDGEILFYVKSDNVIYSSSLNDIDKKITNFKDLNQFFSKKSCDYFYASYLTSIALLDTKYLHANTKLKNRIENRIKLVDRFNEANSFILERCVLTQYRKIHELIKNFSTDYSQVKISKDNFIFKNSNSFQEIMHRFETDNDIFLSFDEINMWLTEKYFKTKVLVKNDIFRTPSENLTPTNCSQYSEYIIINYIINSHDNLNEIKKFSVIGVDEKSSLEIEGLYNDRLIFRSIASNTFKEKEFCFYRTDNNKTKFFHGKLLFQKI